MFFTPILFIGVFSCQSDHTVSHFVELDFRNKVKDTRERNILSYLYYYNGAGVAVGDVVGDSLPDIYLVSNTGENKLLENKGNFRFEDVTVRAKVQGKADWQTGTAMADLNNDGLLDIFVCAVNGLLDFEGHNEVYINNGDGTFREESKKMGLDFEDYSTAWAFLDFDLDGDLDIYLVNHAVHTEDGYRLPADQIRPLRAEKVGDRLLENREGRFVDISEQAGILGSKVNYGLAARVSDINNDGWPDIYVSNDFHENDYLYLNNKDGTFQLATKDYFSYTPRFSMGSDINDINNDGFPDIFVGDMKPAQEYFLKTSTGEDSPEIFSFKLDRGYHYQYSRNTMQMNTPNGFQEIANLAGVSATEWSWSPILEDFNQDGQVDLFVSNGILRRPNDLDFLNYISSVEISNHLKEGTDYDLEIINHMPDGLWHNYLFFQHNLKFEDVSEANGFDENDSSNGCAVADFDGDGDLDIVMNRLNKPALIWKNKSNKNYLAINFTSPYATCYGAKVHVVFDQDTLSREFYPQRGFMSSSEPKLFFGLGHLGVVRKLWVTWPDGRSDTLHNVESNQVLDLAYNPKENRLQTHAVNAVSRPQNEPVAYDPATFTRNALIPNADFLTRQPIIIEQGNIRVIAEPWHPIQIFVDEYSVEHSAPIGLWQSLAFYDKDMDGDLDILVGNLGENSRLNASWDNPLKLYIKDFDSNGLVDYLLAYEKEGQYYPVQDKATLSGQMLFISKKYPDYKSFANANVEEVFDEKLQNSVILIVETLANGWLINQKDHFTWEPLPFRYQAGPVTSSFKKGHQIQISGLVNDYIPQVGLQELRPVWLELE